MQPGRCLAGGRQPGHTVNLTGVQYNLLTISYMPARIRNPGYRYPSISIKKISRERKKFSMLFLVHIV